MQKTPSLPVFSILDLMHKKSKSGEEPPGFQALRCKRKNQVVCGGREGYNDTSSLIDLTGAADPRADKRRACLLRFLCA
jgi:hypothetical protein